MTLKDFNSLSLEDAKLADVLKLKVITRFKLYTPNVCSLLKKLVQKCPKVLISSTIKASHALFILSEHISKGKHGNGLRFY